MESNAYQAMVVLGGGLRCVDGRYFPTTYEDSDPFGMLGGAMRVVAAACAWFHGWTDHFIFTTGVYEKNVAKFGSDVPTESSVYARYFLDVVSYLSLSRARGRVFPSVYMDEVSTTTLTNVREAHRILRAHAFDSIALCSNEYHIPRIKALWESGIAGDFSGIEVTFVSAERVLRDVCPGEYDEMIDVAYRSEAGLLRTRNEARGLADIQSGAYAQREFQLDE